MLRLSSGCSLGRCMRSIRVSAMRVTTQATSKTLVSRQSIASFARATKSNLSNLSSLGRGHSQDQGQGRVFQFARRRRRMIAAVAATAAADDVIGGEVITGDPISTASATATTTAAAMTTLRAKSESKLTWSRKGLVMNQYLPSQEEINKLRMSTSSTIKLEVPGKLTGWIGKDDPVVLLYEVDANGIVLQTIPVLFNTFDVPSSIVDKKYQDWRYHKCLLAAGSEVQGGELAASIIAVPDLFA